MEGKIRRKPEAIIRSFEMDPDKKAVYVEGKSDRLFFEYLFEEIIGERTIFFEIETVDIPEVDEDGNRQRLINFALQIEDSTTRIKCFADADFSSILKESIPNTVILTDFRDLEAYLYEKSYLLKFIKIGLKTDKLTPESILDEISKARAIAILRLCSKDKEFKLPFKKTNKNFSRYYKIGKGINLSKYISALIQNCNNKIKIDEIKKAYKDSEKKCCSLHDRHIIHGKDVIEIIKEIAKTINYKKNNIELIFWMSFDRADINKYPALKKVGEFIK